MMKDKKRRTARRPLLNQRDRCPLWMVSTVTRFIPGTVRPAIVKKAIIITVRFPLSLRNPGLVAGGARWCDYGDDDTIRCGCEHVLIELDLDFDVLIQLYDAWLSCWRCQYLFGYTKYLFGYTNIMRLYILRRSLEKLLHQVKRDYKVYIWKPNPGIEFHYFYMHLNWSWK